MFEFLKAVSKRQNEEVAAELWRVAVVQPPPFFAQLFWVERLKAIDIAFNRSRFLPRHRYAASCVDVFGLDCCLATR